jgi:hypothetical protein
MPRIAFEFPDDAEQDILAYLSKREGKPRAFGNSLEVPIASQISRMRLLGLVLS